ncbi:MAG: HNH endonuclease, partial [Nocardioidaceae bacterium]
AWHAGGPTDLANGCLLCSYHHHLVHKGQWAVVMAPDGIPDIIPPAHLDPAQRPIRHQRFKPRRE